MPNDNFFTGAGATGVTPDTQGYGAIGSMYTAGGAGYVGIGSGLATFKNPGEVHGYQWFNTQSAATRLTQADTVFSQNIARSSATTKRLQKLKGSDFVSTAIESEILTATSMTRGEYINMVAPRFNLEPKLVGAFILTEQRDQSEAEDVGDYVSAFHAGRKATSIGLGQVTGTTAEIHALLTAVFKPAFVAGVTKEWEYLVDEAININAVAKYIRLVANAAAQIQLNNANGVHASDRRCRQPTGGTFTNTALRDLSKLSGPSSTWTSDADSLLPATPPTTITNRTNGTPYVPLPTQAEWDARWSGQYYVRLLGTEYTSCPFDPDMLRFGITSFEDNGSPGSPDWVYLDDGCYVSTPTGPAPSPLLGCVAGWWGQWVSEAYDDCKNCTHI